MEPILLRPGEGEVLRIGRNALCVKAGGDDTAGRFLLAESTLEPGFPGPPPHVHDELHDMFYVLEGTLTLRYGEDEIAAPPGTFACIPPGTVHTFSNPGDEPVRLLNLMAPGGFEQYLKEAAAAPDRMTEIASKYDFEPASV